MCCNSHRSTEGKGGTKRGASCRRNRQLLSVKAGFSVKPRMIREMGTCAGIRPCLHNAIALLLFTCRTAVIKSSLHEASEIET